MLAISLLSACQAPTQVSSEGSAVKASALPSKEPVKVLDPTEQKEHVLAEILNLYAEGRYDIAVEQLTPLIGAPELPLSSQVKVLKFMAFSHCAMGRLRPCRQHFDMALQLDPTFQLTEAEKGHPVWGRQFNNARIALRSKRSTKEQ
jgi:hypothetical protein